MQQHVESSGFHAEDWNEFWVHLASLREGILKVAPVLTDRIFPICLEPTPPDEVEPFVNGYMALLGHLSDFDETILPTSERTGSEEDDLQLVPVAEWLKYDFGKSKDPQQRIYGPYGVVKLLHTFFTEFLSPLDHHLLLEWNKLVNPLTEWDKADPHVQDIRGIGHVDACTRTASSASSSSSS